MTGGRLSEAVEQWAKVNGGELNAMQVRQLLRELRRRETAPPPLPGDPGWADYNRGRLDVLREAQQKAAESRDACLHSDLHDEDAVRHWAGTSGWLRHAVAAIERGDEPFWDDQARSIPAAAPDSTTRRNVLPTTPVPRFCFGCDHSHLEGSPGRCWEAACDPRCEGDHSDNDGKPWPYVPDSRP